MKVYYPGPGSKTYHPQLGKLIKDKDFDLPDDEAKKHIKNGLLKKSELKAESPSPKAEGKTNKKD